MIDTFATLINSIKPAMNNPEIFVKWLKDECVELEKPINKVEVEEEELDLSVRAVFNK